MTRHTSPNSVGDALQRGRTLLEGRSESPSREAEILLCRITGRDSAGLIVRRDEVLDDASRAAYLELVKRRARGEPIAYLTGEREFWSLGFRVGPATLIPRHDTETLVERALDLIPGNSPWRILDLGTGSGNIAIAVALARPRCRVHGVEIDRASLQLARDNARRHRVANVEFELGNWLDPFENERFQMVLGNPPYIAERDPHLEQGDAAFEPRRALVSGRLGLDDIRHIAATAPSRLTAPGWLLLEHGHEQGAAVRQLFQQAGLRAVRTLDDLAGRQRVTEGCMGR